MPSTQVTIPAKPPRYWIAAKRHDGVSDAGAGRIWYRIYTAEKRVMAWLAAPEEEWREHGLRKPI